MNDLPKLFYTKPDILSDCRIAEAAIQPVLWKMRTEQLNQLTARKKRFANPARIKFRSI